MTGWIKLHRQITENELYLAEPFNKMLAWIDLLLLASREPRTLFIRGVEINLSPGELCWSLKTLAARWKWDRRTVSSFLSWLETRQMVYTRKTNITTIITIKNWEFYQGNVPQDVLQNDTRMYTNKNVNNEKNFLNDPASKSHCACPPWREERLQPDEAISKAGAGVQAFRGAGETKSELRPGPHDKKEENHGTYKAPDPFSVKSRLSYRPDPERSRARFEQLKQLFGKEH